MLSTDECLKILSDIATGKARKVYEEIIIPTDSDRIKAINELLKIQKDEENKQKKQSKIHQNNEIKF